jgi:hypoxanthine phosphoribosyltransferase
LILDRHGLRATVRRLAAALDATCTDGTVIVAVLKGSMIFTSDLVREISFHPLIDFIAVSSFSGGDRVRIVKDLNLDVRDLDVVLVEGIVDTGLSLQYLLGELEGRGPASLRVCTLVDKPHRRLLPIEIDHVGLTVDDDFLIGYGLDFAGRYRNLDVLAAADLELLAADPDCYRAWAYGESPPPE